MLINFPVFWHMKPLRFLHKNQHFRGFSSVHIQHNPRRILRHIGQWRRIAKNQSLYFTSVGLWRGLLPSEALLFLCSLSSVCIIQIRCFGSRLCFCLQTLISLVTSQIELRLDTRPVVCMGPNMEALCLRIEAERATETWCFNCTTDDGQSPKMEKIL